MKLKFHHGLKLGWCLAAHQSKILWCYLALPINKTTWEEGVKQPHLPVAAVQSRALGSVWHRWAQVQVLWPSPWKFNRSSYRNTSEVQY